MNEVSKYYECVERRYRPESYRLRAHRAEDENEVLREGIAERDQQIEARDRKVEARDREVEELRRQLEAHEPRRRRRRRNNPPTE